MVEVIGDGTYGTVWKGIYIESGEKVAIKKLKSKIKTWQECVELKEVKALSKLKTHPNVIKLKEVIRETNSEVFFVFEYADTNLYEYIEGIKKRGESFPESRVKEIIYQIANGLRYIHSNGYFHRDMKPENILIMKDGGEITVKIADFGLAKEIPSFYNNSQMTDYVCTRWYRPPECILKSTNYSSAMDIWAIGCIMAELLMLSPIFPGNSEFDQLTRVVGVIGTPKLNDWPEGYKLIQKLGMKFSISNGVHLSNMMPSLSPQGINFLYELFTWDPLLRPTCAKILTHPYFEDIRHKHHDTFSQNNLHHQNSNLNKYHPSSSSSENISLGINPSNNNYSSLMGDDYLNNFNYKSYRTNNNYIPEMTTNYGSSLFNQNNNYNSKSKLSNLAENDMKYNKYKGNMINTNNYGGYNYDSSNFGIKNDYYSTNRDNNFMYDVGLGVGNATGNNYSKGFNVNVNEYSSRKYNYKSDLENQININNNMYSKGNLFNYPQIYI
jgi:serine/threonine protein kinase